LAVFDIQAKECNPEIPNGFSPNGDGYNDWFNIQGLYDVFYAHELLVYNRYGKLIFVGDNDHKWYGFANRGTNSGNKKVPVGTYYYVLKLNNNTPPLIGWVYLNY
jgi:gliding motility-associated-like protein